MIHAGITLVFCITLLVSGFSGYLVCIPIFFYIGREYTQAEYRYIEAHGGKRSECPWWCGLAKESWTVKGVMDWFLPTVVAIATVLVFNFIKG